MRSTHTLSVCVCVSVCVSHSAGELESAEEGEDSTLAVTLLFDEAKCIGPSLCMYLFVSVVKYL
jgi:hypothetical protein